MNANHFRISIPVVIGCNRLRGKSEGAMIKDDSGNSLDRLRQVMREEAIAKSIEATDEWLNTVVSQFLRMYEEANRRWRISGDGSIGHVLELTLPSGRTILLGDERVLAWIGPAVTLH